MHLGHTLGADDVELVEHEVVVGEGPHLGKVHAELLDLLRRADAALRQGVLDLEEGEGNSEDDGPDHDRADRLRTELTEPETPLVVEDPGDARGAGGRTLGGEVPTGSVVTRG